MHSETRRDKSHDQKESFVSALPPQKMIRVQPWKQTRTFSMAKEVEYLPEIHRPLVQSPSTSTAKRNKKEGKKEKEVEKEI